MHTANEVTILLLIVAYEHTEHEWGMGATVIPKNFLQLEKKPQDPSNVGS